MTQPSGLCTSQCRGRLALTWPRPCSMMAFWKMASLSPVSIICSTSCSVACLPVTVYTRRSTTCLQHTPACVTLRGCLLCRPCAWTAAEYAREHAHAGCVMLHQQHAHEVAGAHTQQGACAASREFRLTSACRRWRSCCKEKARSTSLVRMAAQTWTSKHTGQCFNSGRELTCSQPAGAGAAPERRRPGPPAWCAGLL